MWTSAQMIKLFSHSPATLHMVTILILYHHHHHHFEHHYSPTCKSGWISRWKGFWEKLRAGGRQKSCQRRGWKLGRGSCQKVSSTRIWLKRPKIHQSRWNTVTCESLVSRKFSRIFFLFHFSISISRHFHFTFHSRSRFWGISISLFILDLELEAFSFHFSFSK